MNTLSKTITVITVFLMLAGTAAAGQVFHHLEDIGDQVIKGRTFDGAYILKKSNWQPGYSHSGSFSGWGDLTGYTDLTATLTFTWHDDTTNLGGWGFQDEPSDPGDGLPYKDLAKVSLDGILSIDGVEVGETGSQAPTVHVFALTDLGLLDDGSLNYTIGVSDLDRARMDFIVDSVALEITGTPSAVPVPGAFWLLGSGLLGLAGMRRTVYSI